MEETCVVKDLEKARNGCSIDHDLNNSVQKELKKYSMAQTLLLGYQSIGVVYGDLGTSTIQVFSSVTIKDLNEESLVGFLSLIIWSLTLLILIKYVFIVLNADDHGEGGTFALYSRLCQHLNFKNKLSQDYESDGDMAYFSPPKSSSLRSRTKKFLETSSTAQSFLTFIVLVGTCMVIGDGALTPATCVLSALQGIQTKSTEITQDHIVFIAVVLFILLFAVQKYGTGKVGFTFAPIMLLWYITNALISIYQIIHYHPSILKAISPHYFVKFFVKDGKTAWELLGAVFLCLSGAEALFADLGHFNKRAIQLGFSFIVYPSMILSYAGVTAYLVHHPEKISDAYYSSLPSSVYWPMFVISILAAIIASQSMISATYSIVKQSMVLGCFPRVNMVYTSPEHEGQVYSPEINYTLMVICIGLVVGFRGGAQLTNAYGVVVIWVMIITTCLTALFMIVIWDTNPLLILAFFMFYISIESLFMTSLVKKIPQGGWVPFMISALFLVVMGTWRYGRIKKSEYEAERKANLSELNQILSLEKAIYRTPGICFFCTRLVNGIPPIVTKYIQNTQSVHEVMVILTLQTLPVKTVPMGERFNVSKVGNNGVYRCFVQFGYTDTLNKKWNDNYVELIMEKLREQLEISLEEKQNLVSAAEKGVVFVIGRTILRSNRGNQWIKRITIDYLYRFIQKNCRANIQELPFPLEKTMQVGMFYEI